MSKREYSTYECHQYETGIKVREGTVPCNGMFVVYLCNNAKPDLYAMCQEKLVGEKIQLLLLLVYFGDKTPLEHKRGCNTLKHLRSLHHLEHKRGIQKTYYLLYEWQNYNTETSILSLKMPYILTITSAVDVWDRWNATWYLK